MNRDLFEEALELMFKAFSPPKPADKMDVYYHFFAKQKPSHLARTAELCARSCQRFPPVEEFSEKLRIIKSTMLAEESPEEFECDTCSSTGFVIIRSYLDGSTVACKCECVLGAKYGRLKLYSDVVSEENTYFVDNVTDINNNKSIYERGLEFLKQFRINIPNKIKAIIKQDIDLEVPF